MCLFPENSTSFEYFMHVKMFLILCYPIYFDQGKHSCPVASCIVVYDYVKYFKEYYYPNTPTASLRIRSESKVDSASGLRVAVFRGWRSFCTASLFIPIAMHFFSLIRTMKMKGNWNEYLEDCLSFRKSTSAIRQFYLIFQMLSSVELFHVWAL